MAISQTAGVIISGIMEISSSDMSDRLIFRKFGIFFSIILTEDFPLDALETSNKYCHRSSYRTSLICMPTLKKL